MDSGNSGSMQSSSGGGGDEEYDSRTESISPFLNPSGHFGSVSNPSLSHQQNHPPTFFDPSSHNLDAFSQSPANPNANNLYNLDSIWSRGLRSEPNYTDFGNLTALSSSTAASSQSLLGSQGSSQVPFPSSSSMPSRSSVHENAAQPSDPINVGKNPKKRTRASRRAPTTVLTTDTTNFRQLVQEFTGIPTAPFSAASQYSRRLDLFSAGSNMRSGHLDTLGPLYSLRPSAQTPYITTSTPSLSSSYMIGNDSNKYQQYLMNMQNPFQAAQETPFPSEVKHPSAHEPTFGMMSSTVPMLNELGSTSHQHQGMQRHDGRNDDCEEHLGWK